MLQLPQTRIQRRKSPKFRGLELSIAHFSQDKDSDEEAEFREKTADEKIVEGVGEGEEGKEEEMIGKLLCRYLLLFLSFLILFSTFRSRFIEQDVGRYHGQER